MIMPPPTGYPLHRKIEEESSKSFMNVVEWMKKREN
jgi:hypothetical protein